jgi:hypothetical protein
LVFYPAGQSSYSVMRWTVPKTGHYTISTKFTGLCGQKGQQKTMTDVFLLHGTKMLLRDSLNAPERPNEISSDRELDLNAKDALDFAVGLTNPVAECKSTGVEVIISGPP